MEGLNPSIALFNQSGATASVLPAGRPYIDANGFSGLDPGQMAAIRLEFTDPSNAAIAYSTQVLAGSGNR